MIQWLWEVVLPSLEALATNAGVGEEWDTMVKERTIESVNKVYDRMLEVAHTEALKRTVMDYLTDMCRCLQTALVVLDSEASLPISTAVNVARCASDAVQAKVAFVELLELDAGPFVRESAWEQFQAPLTLKLICEAK